ncbi:NYN domain-containing protein [Pseudomonas nicosulfuronedens]
MNPTQPDVDSRVAVFVDCDNVSPDILEHALRVAAQFGRVVIRRGYGNHTTLAHRWQEELVRQAFTPCLQFQYAAGKNTADIALALDAIEVLFDERADTFCLVTSDSDFAYLCRKLKERGAVVCIVGESKTPDALRNASDNFSEWIRPARPVEASNDAGAKVDSTSKKAEPPKAPVKLRPRFVVEAASLMAANTSDGKISMSALGAYLKRTDPAFSPKSYGHSGLLDMIKTYDLLKTIQEPGGHWSVALAD